MSIFSNILEKLGIQKPATPGAPTAPATQVKPPMPAEMPHEAPTPGQMYGAQWQKPPTPAPTSQPAPTPMAMVDVVSKLDALAKKSSIPLNWRVSIVDLLVVLGIDHSAATIQELAVELGCPASEMSDSARRNIWLHKVVLEKIAENGGNIPASLIHK